MAEPVHRQREAQQFSYSGQRRLPWCSYPKIDAGQNKERWELGPVVFKDYFAANTHKEYSSQGETTVQY